MNGDESVKSKTLVNLEQGKLNNHLQKARLVFALAVIPNSHTLAQGSKPRTY